VIRGLGGGKRALRWCPSNLVTKKIQNSDHDIERIELYLFVYSSTRQRIKKINTIRKKHKTHVI